MAGELKSPKALPIGEIISGKNFCVPLYQRNYKWGKTTARQLAEDLLKSYQNSNGPQKSVGLLTLHRRDRGNVNVYEIIDGQQRLITLSIIFSLLKPDGKLKLDGEPPIIDLTFLTFARDGEEQTRYHAVWDSDSTHTGSTDTDRITRNKNAIREIFGELLEDPGKKDAFAAHILKNCVMLCTVLEEEPEKEFMNLNAYKTGFSVCDYVRANLISLNTFYPSELEKKSRILASCLEKHSYKTAISFLYDGILEILYAEPKENGTYKSVYDLVLNRHGRGSIAMPIRRTQRNPGSICCSPMRRFQQAAGRVIFPTSSTNRLIGGSKFFRKWPVPESC